jgi:hypothetical protein
MHAEPRDIQIRLAAPADRGAVERLALLDSAGRVEGESLVAVVEGRVRAALPLERMRVISDPFEPSGDLGTLLLLRARQLDGDDARRSPRNRIRALAHAMPIVGRHA